MRRVAAVSAIGILVVDVVDVDDVDVVDDVVVVDNLVDSLGVDVGSRAQSESEVVPTASATVAMVGKAWVELLAKSEEGVVVHLTVVVALAVGFALEAARVVAAG